MSEPLDLHTDRPHSARVYDYLLGGKDNYAADRAAAEGLLELLPGLRTACRANRAFMHRSAGILAEQGIDQFLDIGTGIPTTPNLHHVVQAVDPAARIVYADNDPIVLAHAKALLTGTAEGAIAYLDADLRDPDAVLGSDAVASVLDLGRPVALSLIAVLHFLDDDEVARGVVRHLVDALPAGSLLTITHATAEFDPEGSARALPRYRASGVPFRLRTREEIVSFFDGLDLLEPGIVQVHKWRPDPAEMGTVDDRDVSWYGGVARKRS